jgi:HEAT repeat protein
LTNSGQDGKRAAVSPPVPVLLSSLLALVVTPAGERLEVRDGATVLVSLSPRTPRARRGVPVAREVTSAGHQLIEVRIPVGGGPSQEVWIGERRSAGATSLWTGLVGPLDGDGETARNIAVGPEGIDVYRTANRITRCDGAPARLFTERWDFERRRFRPAAPPLPPPAAQALQARARDAEMPRGRPAGGFSWTAASSAAGVTELGGLPAPVALDDGDARTAWMTGGSDGRGEFLTARTAADGVAVVGLRLTLAPAVAGRPVRQPRKLVVLLGAGEDLRFDLDLPERPRASEPLWAPLPRPVVSSCVTVVIREATRGQGPVALADLAVITDVDGPDGIARLVRATREGGACDGRVALLVQAGPAAVEPVARAIAAGPAPGRECLLDALARLLEASATAARHPAVSEALVAALDRASESEEKRVLSTLPRLTDPPVAALARLLADPRRPEPERTRAARALTALWGGPHPGTAKDTPSAAAAKSALLAAVGLGPPAVLLTVRQRLAGAPPPLAAAARRALEETPRTETSRRADLILVAGTAAAREPGEAAATVEALRAAVGPGEPFPVQARAIEALGRLAGEASIAELARVTAGSTDPVLRYLAARELATASSAAAVAALRAGLDDADPRVRETAALALGDRGDKEAAVSLMAAAKREPWPFVRRAQVTALGTLCTPGTTDLLIRAEERDLPEVRRAALEGVARCRDARAPALLLARLENQGEDPDLRAVAARLLGELADRRQAARLADTLARLRIESQTDVALAGVTVVALRALARLGGPDALRAARGLLEDQRAGFRRAAVEALATLCGAGTQALETATRDPDPTVAAAAVAGRRRCKEGARPPAGGGP